MIQNKIVSIFFIVFTSLTASIGNLIVAENAGKKYEIFKCEQTVSFILCGNIVPCFLGLVNNLISVWLGSEYVLSKGVIYAISCNLYLSCVLQPLWTYREAAGMYIKTKWIMVICAVLNIILSVFLGKHYGITGVLIASALSRISTYVWYEPRLLFSLYFNKKAGEYFKELSGNFLLVFLLCVLAEKISGIYWAENWARLFFKGIIMSCIFILSSVWVYRKTEGFIRIRQRLLKFVYGNR